MKSKFYSLIIILFVLTFNSVQSSYAQSGAIGIYGTVTEYDGDLNGNKHQFYDFKFVKPGAAISLQQYLNSSFNLEEKFSFNQVRYQNNAATLGVDADFLVLNLKLKYKFNNGYFFKETSPFAPFLVGGIGGNYIKSTTYTSVSDAIITDKEFKGNAAFGGGILFQFNDRLGLEVANTVNVPLYDGWDGVTKGGNDMYLQHSAGLVFNFKKPTDTDNDGIADRKDKCPDTPPQVSVDSKGCPVDSDLDGVADYLDKCPTDAGTSELNGCPDKDRDMVADKDDKCPDVSGLARFAGCPDTDKDGVEDANDKCPNLAGLDAFMGCPDTDKDGVEDAKDKCSDTPSGIKVDETGCPADSDGDGVVDSKDLCPSTKGEGSVNGCPVIKEEVKKRLNFATRGIAFETGRATLKLESFPKLDEIVSILGEYTDYNLRLGGYTDSQGSDDTNLKLSQDRVNSVKAYLIGKGVSEARLEAIGYGKARPIATNATAVGRSQNRRVEMELFLKP